MLTKKQKTEWVAALRSGDFPQGTNYLETQEGKFCCLGVLAKINGLATVDSSLERGSHSSINLAAADDDFTHGGVFYSMEMPQLRGYGSLASANDAGVTFTEIADHIEKYLPASD